MKKAFTIITSLCLCATALAAENGKSIKASNVFGNRFLETISDVSEGDLTTLTYNSQSQLISVKSVERDWVETTTFDYSGGTVNGTDYDVMMVITDSDETTTLYITVGDNLFASSVYQVTSSKYDGESTSTWGFEYNAVGQLVKMARSEGSNEVTSITYSDGDIVKVEVDDDDNDHDSSIVSYVNAPMNTSSLMLFDFTFGIDMDEMGIAYFAGLLGKPTNHLPTSLVDEEGDKETFSWTLDSNGCPTALVNGSDTYQFTWTEFSGIQDVQSAAVQPIEYYNLQGVRIAAPTHGLNIVRNSDGSTSKTLKD